LVRPEGTLSAEHRASDVTKDFYWRLSSTIDPGVLRPLLSADQQRAFNLLSLSAPPILDAEIWGRSHEPERIGFEARAELTNFVFREQTFSSLLVETAHQYIPGQRVVGQHVRQCVQRFSGFAKCVFNVFILCAGQAGEFDLLCALLADPVLGDHDPCTADDDQQGEQIAAADRKARTEK